MFDMLTAQGTCSTTSRARAAQSSSAASLAKTSVPALGQPKLTQVTPVASSSKSGKGAGMNLPKVSVPPRQAMKSPSSDLRGPRNSSREPS
jgi:hypothetical protein